ncbi:MAG: phage integrase central domain-containing protein, partial [Haliea sp.]
MSCRESAEFKNAKHAAQWLTTLEKYVIPQLGKLPVAEIDTPQVLAVLQPIWAEVPETASSVRQRISAVFD